MEESHALITLRLSNPKSQAQEKLLSFGTSPEVFLASAREQHEEARKQVAVGIDPSISRKKGKEKWSGQGPFEAVARERLNLKSPGWSPMGWNNKWLKLLSCPNFVVGHPEDCLWLSFVRNQIFFLLEVLVTTSSNKRSQRRVNISSDFPFGSYKGLKISAKTE